jgi:hypothetical protein
MSPLIISEVKGEVNVSKHIITINIVDSCSTTRISSGYISTLELTLEVSVLASTFVPAGSCFGDQD